MVLEGRLRRRLTNLAAAALAVADADPARIEGTAVRLGRSRRYLAPLAWAAGTLVLVVRGVTLLITNWRLMLIEIVPAAWVWLAMWDIKRDGLRAEPLQTVTAGQLVAFLAIAVGTSIAAFWCNTVFGFAISNPPPRISPSARLARPFLRPILVFGTAMGVLVTVGVLTIPRIGPTWLYLVGIGALYSLMLVTLVVVPARILGIGKRRLAPHEAVGRWMTSGALSAVAMTPGFVLDRIGLALLGIPGLHVVGFVVLSAGVGLYAAGLSSVKAIKLSIRFEAANSPESGTHV